VEQNAQNLQAQAQDVLSEAGEGMTDVENSLNAAARRQQIVLQTLMKINDMPGDQLKGEMIRSLLHDIEMSNKVIQSIVKEVQ
jgi:hypothetical protein